jgi:hypothetical protein
MPGQLLAPDTVVSLLLVGCALPRLLPVPGMLREMGTLTSSML